MKLKLLIVGTLAVAASVPAFSTAGPAANGTDRASANRACSALRSSVGARTFAQTFAAAQSSRAKAFGKCVSSFARVAEQARSTATTACTAEQADPNFATSHSGQTFQQFYGGKNAKQAFKGCVASHVTSTLNEHVTAMKNAATTCKSLRSSMGVTAFNQRFGKNANDRNAFGKCVSSQVSNGAASRRDVFRAELSPLNGSGVTGSAVLRLRNGTLTVKLDARGVEPNQSHLAHIHGFATDTKSVCPGAAADTNGDKIISFQEGLASFGPVLVELASQQVGANGRLEVTKTITQNVAALQPLTDRTIVVHGLTVSGTYVPTLPVACGAITGR